jgi:ACR3 family arsenite transporter
VFVPLILYFIIIWIGVFGVMYYLTRRQGKEKWGYEMAVVQAFTAGSNKYVANPSRASPELMCSFELAIAVCIAVYGANSDEALAATIGPLVEVPVMLLLTYVALYTRSRWTWAKPGCINGKA